MTKRLSLGEKIARKPTPRACTFCHSKHLQCSNTRPCQNCIKRKIEHGCKDVVRKRASYLYAKGESKSRGKNVRVNGEKENASAACLSSRESSVAEDMSDASKTTKASDNGIEFSSRTMFSPQIPQRVEPCMGATPVNKTEPQTNNQMKSQMKSQTRSQTKSKTTNQAADQIKNQATDQMKSQTNFSIDQQAVNQNQNHTRSQIEHHSAHEIGHFTGQNNEGQIDEGQINDFGHMRQINHVNQLNPVNQVSQTNNMDLQMESAPTSLDTFHDQTKDTPSSTPSTTANFRSMFLNQEYMMLGDLISKPTSPSLGFATAAPGQLMTPDFFGGFDGDGDSFDTRPYISLGDGDGKSARENGFNFDLRAGDEHEYVSPLLSHHIYQTVQDIYSNRIINFDYPSSYHSLTHFLKHRFAVTGSDLTPESKTRKRSNLLVILKLIASYRPTFISAHKSLFQPFDFQFLEMSFQRCLLDFENLSRLNASPMIIWRRTGEIVSMSAHLADILGLNISDVLSKRTFIIELMYDDESIVEYFRLFKSVAIGSLHSTIFTKCKLIKRPSDHMMSTSKTNARLKDVEYIEFCSVWTVKRDLFDLPMMIVGHFLPSLPNNDAIRSY